MPFFDEKRKMWRGQVVVKGTRLRKDFTTKAAAKEWETTEKNRRKSLILPDMDLLTLLNRYLDYAEIRYMKSHKTLLRKKRLCRNLIKFFGNVMVETITDEAALEFLKTRGQISADCYNRDRKEIAVIWRWGMKYLRLPENPWTGIETLPHKQEVGRTPTLEEIQQLVDVAKPVDKVFLNIFLATGARVSEILRLTWEDVNVQKSMIRLGNRKNRSQTMEYVWLPVNQSVIEDLKWLYDHRKQTHSPYLFPASGQGRMGSRGKARNNRYYMLQGLCQKAGVPTFGFHGFRRFVASRLSEDFNIPTVAIQQLLRHKKLGTTERYIKNLNTNLREVASLLDIKSPQEDPQDENAEDNYVTGLDI